VSVWVQMLQVSEQVAVLHSQPATRVVHSAMDPEGAAGATGQVGLERLAFAQTRSPGAVVVRKTVRRRRGSTEPG